MLPIITPAAASNEMFISPGKYADGTLETTQLLGDRLANVVLRMMGRLQPVSSTPLRLRSWREHVALRADLPSQEEVRKQLDAAKSPGAAWRIATLLNVVQNPHAAQLDLFVLEAGDWQWVGFPAEFFVDGALAVRAAARKPFTLVGAYYDCTLWYIPTIPAMHQGKGYEANGDWNYTAPGTAEQIVRAVIQRLD